MSCPLCGQRRARRGCPALGKQICAYCCGTKRLVEIRCPSDCPYLATAREHPPAVVVRQQQRDLGFMMQLVRDFNERQSQLFFLLGTFLAAYRPPDIQPLLDDDLADAATALSATLETASRGVIYEHRPASLPAERLMAAFKPVIAEAGRSGGSAFERDAAVVLRRFSNAVREARETYPENRRALLDVIARMIRKPAEASEPAVEDVPRLIVP